MVGPGILEETIKNVENEKCTLCDMEYGKNNLKRGQWEQTLYYLEYGEKQ